MNKFTLTFYHKDLETQYQNTRLRMRNIIFFVIALFYTLSNGFCLIISLINDTTKQYMVNIFIIAIIVLLIICNIYAQSKICYWLSILNIAGCFIQCNFIYHFSNQEIYILGGNIMVCHMLILQKTDFVLGTIQIILIFTLRLMFQAYFENINYIQIGLSFMILLFLSFVLFRTDKNRRKQFLLTLKDNHWDLQLSKMINKPFFYFEYDHRSFQLKQTNQLEKIPIYNNRLCEGCNLRRFLREYTYKDQALEELLLKRAKGRVPLIQNFEMVCHNKKKGKLYITFTELFSDAHDYIMTIESSQNTNNLIQLKSYQTFQLYLKKYTKDLVKLLTFKQSKDKIICLNINYLSILFYQNYQITKFQPIIIIQSIVKMLDKQKNFVEVITKENELEIQGYKFLFITAMLQILSLMLRVSKYGQNKLIIEQTESHIKFTVIIENRDLFKLLYRQNKLIKNISKDLFCEQDYGNLSMKIHKDLDIPYVNKHQV